MLTGQIGSIVNVIDGRVDVLDDRGLGARQHPGPARRVRRYRSNSTYPAALVANGMAKLSFVIRDGNQNVNNCTQIPALSISQLASPSPGRPAGPTSVADYLPNYLDKILINVGSNPTYVQQQAALDLVARLTKRYRPMPRPHRRHHRRDRTRCRERDVRVIDIRDGSQPGVVVENPDTPAAMLVISGTGTIAGSQVELFADQQNVLGPAASAVVLSARDDAPLSSNTKTFDQLGSPVRRRSSASPPCTRASTSAHSARDRSAAPRYICWPSTRPSAAGRHRC